MASEQFILEMHKNLHPDSDVHSAEDLTAAGIKDLGRRVT